MYVSPNNKIFCRYLQHSYLYIILKLLIMWCEETENLLKNWGSKAQYYQILYEQAGAMYLKYDRWFGIPLIILGTVTTSTMFIQLDECTQWQRLLSGCLAFSFTLLTAISKFIGYKDLYIKFIQTAQAYDDVVMDIQEQLNRPKKQRLAATDFVATIKIALRKLKKAPSVPEKVFRTYINNIDNHFDRLGIKYSNISPQGITVESMQNEDTNIIDPIRLSISKDDENIDTIIESKNFILSDNENLFDNFTDQITSEMTARSYAYSAFQNS